MAVFCAASRKLIDTAKAGMTAAPHAMYNPENCWSEYYLTSVPWLSLDHISYPIPNDKSSQSVPRVYLDKYREENGCYKVKLNITVSHTLVDGYPLCRTFRRFRSALTAVPNCTDKNVKKSYDLFDILKRRVYNNFILSLKSANYI